MMIDHADCADAEVGTLPPDVDHRAHPEHEEEDDGGDDEDADHAARPYTFSLQGRPTTSRSAASTLRRSARAPPR